MPYLETLISENPNWADDTNLSEMKWRDILSVLKGMWRRYKNVKHRKDFQIMVSLGRTIYDSYLDFNKQNLFLVKNFCKLNVVKRKY